MNWYKYWYYTIFFIYDSFCKNLESNKSFAVELFSVIIYMIVVVINGILYFIFMNLLVIFLFFSIIFNCVLTDHWFSLKNFTVSQGQYISLGLGGMCFIMLFLRYTRKRTAAILVKYKNNKWNKILPTWIICISPLLLLLLGVGIGKLIFN